MRAAGIPGGDPIGAHDTAASLGLRACASCSAVQLPPLPRCRRCGHDAFVPTTSSGRGTVVTHTCVRRQFTEISPQVPYTVVLVKLDEGPRVLGLLAPGEPRVLTGARVRVIDEAVEPRFGPYFGADPHTGARGREDRNDA